MSIVGILAGVGMNVGGVMAKKGAEAFAEKFVEKVVVDRVNGALDKTISAIFKAWKAGHGSSLVSASQQLRVEPYVLVDERAMRLPFCKDVVVLGQKMYTGYYLLANAAENSIAGVKIGKRLEKFGTDRDLRAATASFLSLESYQFGLPFVGESVGLARWGDYSTEANDPSKGKEVEQGKGGKNDATGTSMKQNNLITNIENLAVGQIVDVTISDGTNKADIPVQIRMRPLGMGSSAMASLIALGGGETSNADRRFKFRVGDIKSFVDLVTKQDEVRRYRQALLADKSGYFRKAATRDTKALIATALTGMPSVGNGVSIAILTKDTLNEAEAQMDHRISDFATRQAIFDRGLMMMMMVLDEDHETVTIYTRDIDDYATYTLRDLKAAGSNNGDLADIMKTYLEGRVPGRL